MHALNTPHTLFLIIIIDDVNSTELFHIEAVGGNKVKIVGYPPPGKVRWYLTIIDNQRGVPDQYPKFLAEDGV